jgi:hypothetical protein
MNPLRLLCLCAIGLLSLVPIRPAFAAVHTVNFSGSFGASMAEFPYPDAVRFDGSFTYDSSSGINEGIWTRVDLLTTTFTFYDVSDAAIFQAGYTTPPTPGVMMRVGTNFCNLFLGPGVTPTDDPSDFRLFFSGAQFANTGFAPSPSDLTEGVFTRGFAEAGGFPTFTDVPITSAILSATAAAPEPGTLALLALAGLPLMEAVSRRRCAS